MGIAGLSPLNPSYGSLLVGPQVAPLRVAELLLEEAVPFVGGDAVDRDAFLEHPFEQDAVGDGGDVAAPVALLRQAAQNLVALDDRLAVLVVMNGKIAVP